MILKGSQRGGGQDLARHLMRTDDNEHVRVHELRGFASDDLRGAFKEAEAVSRGTRCEQYLFSLSLSPPETETVSPEVFEGAINRIEDRLGLSGQPRAIVFHEKEGRRHAHCVWSRIDADAMKAKPLPFFKNRLTEISRDLYLENGWSMPKGLSNPLLRDPTGFTLAEWQQAKRLGQDPRWIKAALQECWTASDDAKAFGRALEERGFFLARGDRRGHVVVGHDGEVHALSRALGVKAKEVTDRLGKPDGLKSVAETHAHIGERMSPAMRRHVEDSRERFRDRSAQLGYYKEELTRRHRAARVELDGKQQADTHAGTRERQARLPRGVRGLWHRVTGQYQDVRSRNEREAECQRAAQAAERKALIDAQLEQRARLQLLFKDLRRQQAERLLDLRKDVGRYLRLSRANDPGLGASRGQEAGLGLSLQL